MDLKFRGFWIENKKPNKLLANFYKELYVWQKFTAFWKYPKLVRGYCYVFAQNIKTLVNFWKLKFYLFLLYFFSQWFIWCEKLLIKNDVRGSKRLVSSWLFFAARLTACHFHVIQHLQVHDKSLLICFFFQQNAYQRRRGWRWLRRGHAEGSRLRQRLQRKVSHKYLGIFIGIENLRTKTTMEPEAIAWWHNNILLCFITRD